MKALQITCWAIQVHAIKCRWNREKSTKFPQYDGVWVQAKDMKCWQFMNWHQMRLTMKTPQIAAIESPHIFLTQLIHLDTTQSPRHKPTAITCTYEFFHFFSFFYFFYFCFGCILIELIEKHRWSSSSPFCRGGLNHSFDAKHWTTCVDCSAVLLIESSRFCMFFVFFFLNWK